MYTQYFKLKTPNKPQVNYNTKCKLHTITSLVHLKEKKTDTNTQKEKNNNNKEVKERGKVLKKNNKKLLHCYFSSNFILFHAS